MAAGASLPPSRFTNLYVEHQSRLSAGASLRYKIFIEKDLSLLSE
jgi:hypothetical protein